MRKIAFTVSGIGLLFIWPFALYMTAFLYDAPATSDFIEVKRAAVLFTLMAIPLVWVGSLIAALVLSRRAKKRESRVALTQQGDPTPIDDATLMREFSAHEAARKAQEKTFNACAWAPYVAAGIHVLTVIFLFVTG